jgi:hypothetical protein
MYEGRCFVMGKCCREWRRFYTSPPCDVAYLGRTSLTRYGAWDSPCYHSKSLEFYNHVTLPASSYFILTIPELIGSMMGRHCPPPDISWARLVACYAALESWLLLFHPYLLVHVFLLDLSSVCLVLTLFHQAPTCNLLESAQRLTRHHIIAILMKFTSFLHVPIQYLAAQGLGLGGMNKWKFGGLGFHCTPKLEQVECIE